MSFTVSPDGKLITTRETSDYIRNKSLDLSNNTVAYLITLLREQKPEACDAFLVEHLKCALTRLLVTETTKEEAAKRDTHETLPLPLPLA